MPRKLSHPSYQSELRYDAFDSGGTFEKEISIPTRTIWDVAWECATFLRIVYENAKPCDDTYDTYFVTSYKWTKHKPSELEQSIYQLLRQRYQPSKASLYFGPNTDTSISLEIVYRESHILNVDYHVQYFESIIKHKIYDCCLDLTSTSRYAMNMHHPDESQWAFIRHLFIDTASYDGYLLHMFDFQKFMLLYERTFHCTIHFSTFMHKHIRRKIRTVCFKGAKVEDIVNIVWLYLVCG